MPRTIDTRFFLTHFLAETDELKEQTRKKMIELQGEMAMVPTIVLHEVYKYIHDRLGRDIARLRVDSITTSQLRVVDLTTAIALTSANLRCRYRDLPTADSIVAGTSIETRSKRVVSDDPHFQKINEIRNEWL
jgi:predicted nucleic acid-binding protein